MKKLSIILILLIAIIISGLWGYFQVKLFPVEQYGYLFIFTNNSLLKLFVDVQISNHNC